MKTFEYRKKQAKQPKLDEVLNEAIANSKKAKRMRAEYRAWQKSLPLGERLDSMKLVAHLDTVNFALLEQQADRVQAANEQKAKALKILERKVNYALRPFEKPLDLRVRKNEQKIQE